MTTKPVSFTLGQNEVSFLANMVENGRFGNKTEVVRAGLRLLEDYENSQKLRRLRALISEGDADIQNGNTSEYKNEKDLIKAIIE